MCPVLLPTDQQGLWTTALGICMCCSQLWRAGDSLAVLFLHPRLGTGTTKTFPLVFPARSWGNHVPPLTVCYEMPNTSTGRSGDEELKFWSHGHCSRNAPSPSSIPIHFTSHTEKLPSHLHAVVLQNKRNGSQLYWKISNFIEQTLTASQVFSRNQLIPVTVCLPQWGTLRNATATDGS